MSTLRDQVIVCKVACNHLEDITTRVASCNSNRVTFCMMMQGKQPVVYCYLTSWDDTLPPPPQIVLFTTLTDAEFAEYLQYLTDMRRSYIGTT